MSFKPSSAERDATAAQKQVAQTQLDNSNADRAAGSEFFQSGSRAINPVVGYFNTLMNGNRGNTTALLQPQINAIKDSNAGQISALSTLMPRGGGRSATLFQAPWQANQQIQSLFSGMPAMAADKLAALGSTFFGQGGNLYGMGQQSLGQSGNTQSQLFNQAFQNRQAGNQFWSGLGGGLLNLGMGFATGGIPLPGMGKKPALPSMGNT